jgi:hypothetical protein
MSLKYVVGNVVGHSAYPKRVFYIEEIYYNGKEAKYLLVTRLWNGKAVYVMAVDAQVYELSVVMAA